MKRILTVLLVCCLLLTLMSACGTKKTQETPEPQMAEPVDYPEDITLRFAQSYDEVYESVRQAQAAMDEMKVYNGESAMAEDAAGDGEADESGSYYSGTNVQVEGVDEGDIVKTDGDYIYVLRDVELIILKADGKNVAEVSHTIVGTPWDMSDDENVQTTSEKSPVALYVLDDRAVVISAYYSWTSDDASQVNDNSNYVVIDVYDLTDRSAPKLIKSLGQDGYQVDSRLVGDKLFLCSAYYVYDPDSKDPRFYVPCLYTDGNAEPVPYDCIGLMPQEDSTTYAVLTSYDISAAAVINTQSVLGGGETVYMNQDNLYLCKTVYGDRASESVTEGPYEVTTHITDMTTAVNRFSISEGKLNYEATGSVPGDLNNQFSLDEYDGNLRMATTERNGGYKLYVDEGHKFENYESMDTVTSNDVFILNSDLEIIGSATDIAPDETVYSARFDGDYGYLCTYRTTDPIFAVDLSDPSRPAVVGAVALTGYSDYLHLWTENRLFGLGMQTQEVQSEEGTTATVDGMKMVMIDTSDPAHLTEQSTTQIDADYSQALYNHKAILVDQARNLIAFPAEGNYLVYGFSDDQGFQLKKEIAFENEWDWQSRGLYIGDCFYVVSSDAVDVIDLNTLENVGHTILSRG